MNLLCKGDGTTDHPGAGGDASCWIGLRWNDDGTGYFRWIANNQFLTESSLHDFAPGQLPTAFYFTTAPGEMVRDVRQHSGH